MKRFAKWFVVPAVVIGAMVLGSSSQAEAARFSLHIGSYGSSCAPSYHSYRSYRSYYPSYSVYSGYRPSFYGYQSLPRSYYHGHTSFSIGIPFQSHHFHGHHHHH